MTALAQRLKERFFRPADHPYSILEREIDQLLESGQTLLDAGCGRTAPVLARYRGRGARLIGVDLVDFDLKATDGLEVHNSDLARMPVASESVDLIVARSVMEHLTEPEAVYREMHRVLKPGGQVVFITGNLWDYSAIIAKLVPNRLHPWIVARTEGRKEDDVFPIAYRTNTRRAVERLARRTGFEVVSFAYRGQYPSYFMFNGFLFLLATGYEKLISRVDSLAFLRGWIHVRLRKA